MNKIEHAVIQADTIIKAYMDRLNELYEKVEYERGQNSILLKCYMLNKWRSISIGEDFLGPKPKFYTGMERQKRGGHKKEIEDLEHYKSEEKRIQKTDGLIIKYESHENGKTWEIQPSHQFDSEGFQNSFKSHFLNK